MVETSFNPIGGTYATAVVGITQGAPRGGDSRILPPLLCYIVPPRIFKTYCFDIHTKQNVLKLFTNPMQIVFLKLINKFIFSTAEINIVKNYASKMCVTNLTEKLQNKKLKKQRKTKVIYQKIKYQGNKKPNCCFFFLCF